MFRYSAARLLFAGQGPEFLSFNTSLRSAEVSNQSQAIVRCPRGEKRKEKRESRSQRFHKYFMSFSKSKSPAKLTQIRFLFRHVLLHIGEQFCYLLRVLRDAAELFRVKIRIDLLTK